AKNYSEIVSNKLFSEWIPQDDDAGDISSGIAASIASRRRTLLRDGYRAITFATRLDKADLQIGDHIALNAARYERTGVGTSNPLSLFILSKRIDASLAFIEFSALVLLDNEQSVAGLTAIDPPTAVTITDNADRTVDIAFTASADDDGTDIKYYQIYIRRKSLRNWGGFKTRVTATGAASYTVSGYALSDIGVYDFGVRAVFKSGRVSTIAEALAELVTDATLAAPTWQLIPAVNGWNFDITSEVQGAIQYRVLKFNPSTLIFESVGSIKARLAVNKKRKAGFEPLVSAGFVANGIAYGRFKLATVNEAGEGDASAEQAAFSLPYQGTMLASSLTPSLPAESGTYPTLTPWQNASGEYRYSVTLKLTAAVGFVDFAKRYEFERQPSGGTWEKVGERRIENYPAPETIIWINHDARLTPGVTYNWRARAMAPDGTVSDYSNTLSEEVVVPPTALDQPTITVTPHLMGFRITISEPVRAAAAVTDFSHYKIEANIDTAGWNTIADYFKGQVFEYGLVNASVAESWDFRVTAIDKHGNESTVSAESGGDTVEQLETSTISDIGIQGWQFDATYASDSNVQVSWGAGALRLSDGTTTYNITGANTGTMSALTFIYFDSDASITLLQTTTTPATAIGPNKFIVAVAENEAAGRTASFAAFGGAGGGHGIGLLVAENFAANIITANEMVANSLTGVEINAAANITVGTGNDVIRISGDDATYRWWIGHATAASAPLRATKGGALICTDLTATGTFSTSASGKRLQIHPVSSNIVLTAHDASNNEQVVISPDTGGGSASIEVRDAAGPVSKVVGGGVGHFSGSAFAAIQVSGTGHGECVLADSTGAITVR
ncbi:hypothetical protein LCGC14_1865050, partial [marine sediment metagenome]